MTFNNKRRSRVPEFQLIQGYVDRLELESPFYEIFFYFSSFLLDYMALRSDEAIAGLCDVGWWLGAADSMWSWENWTSPR